MTVSRALRGAPHVTPGVRERVVRAAAELGYRPNPLVTALMGARRSGRVSGDATTLAFVTSMPETVLQTHLWYRLTLGGVAERAAERGFRTEYFHVGEGGLSWRRLLSVLETRSICGAVIAYVDHVPTDGIDWSRLAVAVLGSYVEGAPFHRVEIDHYENMRQALRELRSAGYERVLFSCHPALRVRYEDRYHAAYLDEQRNVPLTSRLPIYEPPTPWPPDRAALDAYYGKLRVVARDCRAEVVVDPAYLPLEVLRELGAKVPGEFGFATLEVPDSTGAFTGIEQDYGALGAAAIDLLEGHMHRHEFGIPRAPKLVTLRGRWVWGESVAAPPGVRAR
jgi:LacI family transcriptional regulator